jgi:hypothetical protein
LIQGKCINYTPFLGKVIDQEKVSFTQKDISDQKTVKYEKKYFYTNDGLILEYEVLNALKSLNMGFDSDTDYSKYLEKLSIKGCNSIEQERNWFSCELAKERIYLANSESASNLSDKLNLLNPNCGESKRQNICLRCPDLSFLRNNKCSPIDLLRVTEVSYNPIKNEYQSAVCETPFFLKFPIRKCSKKIEKCLMMSPTGKCLKCRENYTLSQDQLHCFICPSNCLNCVSSTFCFKCQKGYFLNEDRSKGIYNFISNDS